MYRNGGYIEAADICAKESMARVVEEVKGLSHYASEGEVRVCRVLTLSPADFLEQILAC